MGSAWRWRPFWGARSGKLARMKSQPANFATLAVLATLGVLSTCGRFGSQRIVGFSYSVSVNNLVDECPSTVVSVDGTRLTLDDGRIIVVEDRDSKWIADELTYCENRVRFDAGEQTLFTMRHRMGCGFSRPESCQLITIPINQVQLLQFESRRFAPAHQASGKFGS